MADVVLYPVGRQSQALRPRSAARVANGEVRVGALVRELPASHHFQPCYCCLCRPLGGERPIWEVQSIGERSGTVYLVLDEDYECPADEVERLA